MANPGYPMGPGGPGGMGPGGMGGGMGGPGMPGGMGPGGPGGMMPGGMGPGGMGMGPGGMGGPTMQRPAQVMRRGTSKAVPVVVSAGLAVGVFCGLLFGVGTGEKAVAAPSTGTNNVKATTDTGDTTPTETKIDQSLVGLANKVDKSGSAAGSGSADAGSAAAAAPTIPAAPAKPKLTVELMPPDVAATAKITVDGTPLENTMVHEVDLAGADKKEVKVVVKAKDYKEIEQKVTVDSDTTLKLELVKTKTTSTRPVGKYTPPKTGGSSGGSKGTKKKPDNQIDI